MTMMSRWPQNEFTGLSITRLARVDSGRLHVALARLESEGRVVSRWGGTTPPRRRFYRLTDAHPDTGTGANKVTV